MSKLKPIRGCPAKNGGRHKRIPNPEATIVVSPTGLRMIQPSHAPSICAHCGRNLPGRWLLPAPNG